jgi:hypothetical protein
VRKGNSGVFVLLQVLRLHVLLRRLFQLKQGGHECSIDRIQLHCVQLVHLLCTHERS